MKTTKTNKNNEIQIGDKVKFVVGTSLLTGVITKFYKNSYGDEECSVKTELNTLSGKINHKIFPHILLHRVSKIEGIDEVEVVREMRQQIVDLEQENKQLKEQLAEKDKEIERFNNNKLAQTRPYEEFEGKSLYEISQIYENQVRKQICDEIREKIKKQIIEEDISDCNTDYGDKCWLYAMEVDMAKILDQIEQGE